MPPHDSLAFKLEGKKICVQFLRLPLALASLMIPGHARSARLGLSATGSHGGRHGHGHWQRQLEKFGFELELEA